MSVGNIYKYARDGLPWVLRTLAMTCIKPGMTCEARAAEPLASSTAEPKRSCACAMTKKNGDPGTVAGVTNGAGMTKARGF